MTNTPTRYALRECLNRAHGVATSPENVLGIVSFGVLGADAGNFAQVRRVRDSSTPPALLQGLLHLRAVHERVMLLTIITEKVARVPPEQRVRIEAYETGFSRAIARYGFKETPDLPELFQQHEFDNDSLEYVTLFLGRETVLANEHAGMALWRERRFAVLTHNAQPATAFFGIPPSQVIEIGTQIEI